jgi:segregation and condensation protein A
MSYRVRLDMFEGPLDLLLYLIQVNEIDIYDIPIAKITEEYLNCLATMEALDLEVAGEFLVTAATLIQIKSRMLIPAQEAEAEDLDHEDPRRELVERLLEYKRFKEAALTLDELESQQRLLYLRPGDAASAVAEGPLQVSLSELLHAFAAVMQRAPKEAALEIAPEAITVSERMVALIERLTLESPLPFTALFEEAGSRAMLITTFLALLELLRRGLIRARQTQPQGEIMVYRAVEAPEADNGRST